MKKVFDWSTRQGKMIWLSIAFVVGFVVLPFFTQPYWDQSKNTWMMPLVGKLIILDPGHGGPDGGAVSKDGLVEKEVTLKIALYLRDYLQEAGAFVIMTRETDTDLAGPGTQGLARRKVEDLIKRIHLIQEKNADAFISIHLNSFPSQRWTGAQTFYNPTREENQKLASFIQSEIIRNLKNTNRLPKQKGDIYILKNSTIPTALVEVGFLSNPNEAKMLGSEEYQKKLAATIYYGIMGYYSGEKPPLP